MHITLESDYAIRIVLCLAKANKKIDANTISELSSVSLRFSLKILRKLVSEGIVKSFKGTQGGYELNRPLNTISLKDILQTVEGKYFFSRCLSPETPCNRNAVNCKVQRVFAKITLDVSTTLEQTTIDQLI